MKKFIFILLFLSSCYIKTPETENLYLDKYKSSVTTITTNINRTSIYTGHKVKIDATVEHLDLSKNSNVEFSSSDNTIAVVDQNGYISGLKEGFTTIVVTAVENKKISRLINVFVKNQDFEEALVIIDNKEISIKVGEKFKLNASVKLSNGNILPNIIWKAEDDSIAEVSQDGIVLGKKIGETKIFALAEGNQNKNEYTKVNVK